MNIVELKTSIQGLAAETGDALLLEEVLMYFKNLLANWEADILGFEQDGTPITEKDFMLGVEEAHEDLRNGQLLTQNEAKALFKIYG